MGTLRVTGWKDHPTGWNGWDRHPRELTKRIRRAVNGSPDLHRQIERQIRDRGPVSISGPNPKYLEDVRLILESLGADVVLDLSGTGAP